MNCHRSNSEEKVREQKSSQLSALSHGLKPPSVTTKQYRHNLVKIPALLSSSYKWQRLWLKKHRAHPHKTKRIFGQATKAFASASTLDSDVVNSPVHTPPSPFGHKPFGLGVS